MAEKNDKSERSKCRDPECSKTFSNKSNRDRPEKRLAIPWLPEGILF